MSAQPQLESPVTPEEYLAFERQVEEKNEFIGGVIYPMSGASLKHNQLTTNCAMSLWTQFKKSDYCEVLISKMRVKVNKTDYVYPDVVAICGKVQLEDEYCDTLLNPTVIIEILSKPTRRYDKTLKADLYQNMPTMQDYVLVAQDQYRIEHYQRKSQNQWLLTVLTDPRQVLQLNSVKAEISVQDIYEKVDIEIKNV
ncbi:Uma2 family endonuclease [Candidatus Albibeggiatoa sp. nov. NOAA]|uniref:Uma2 family endonuclease n=1 Tax=Candidatus Albibeggiatoa sp. nov. NOAA TaxID=3162724 RepID=UPI0032F176D3|nr:Uma2 family endonuclease [Thiotrichaceae bacterium]